MDLVERLYAQEDEKLKRIWNYAPFNSFNPKVPLLGFKAVKKAISSGDSSFFVNIIRNNFFPDKTAEEVAEAKRYAINRGITALNTLCQTHLPEYFDFFQISQIESPFDPLQFMAKARDSWLKARHGKHKKASPNGVREYWIKTKQGVQKVITDKPSSRPVDSRPMLEAYNTVRAWGLGYLVLLIDESPEIFNSVHHRELIERWFHNHFNFENAQQVSEELFSWDNRSRLKVYGTINHPFRQRAKIHDDAGNIRYSSLLMKMFLKQGFLDRIHDTYGVEFIVENEEAVKKLLSYFKREIRGTTTIEKYVPIEHEEPPRFFCDKFILRVPVRVTPPSSEPKKLGTLRRPLEKYIRLPVEVQIRALDRIDQTAHALYKQQQYMRVFPLWYPREIYTPFLEDISPETQHETP